MKNDKKIIFSSLFIALTVELFLIYIVYFTPTRIQAILPASTQQTLSGLFNLLTAQFLVFGIISIKKKLRSYHLFFIHLALLSSFLFLINYITYHLSTGHIVFNNQEVRPYYLFVLITHLLASVVSLPLIFMTYALGIFNRLDSHRKIARITFYLWEYVALTGVLLILLIRLFHLK